MDTHKQKQREHFDAAAKTMPKQLPLRDNVMALHQLIYNRNVRRLPLNDGDRILEVGFGWVQLIRVLAGEANFQGVGMDLSLSMVAAAHRERGRMNFLAGDAEQFPFSGESFDGLIALSLLEHLTHQEQALREMWRVLKPGGHLLMQFPVRDDAMSWQFFYRLVFPGRFRQVLARLAHDPALVPDTGEIKKVLSQTGFHLLWASRDEVFFQPLYDYYVLGFLDRLKLWKDHVLHGSNVIPEKTDLAQSQLPSCEARGRWKPQPAGIHRVLLPLASALLLPDYALGKLGIGAGLWILARKKTPVALNR